MGKKEPPAMRPDQALPPPAPAPAPLQEITFDIFAFLGDDQRPPADREMLQNVLEAPPAQVPSEQPPPAPAAAAGPTDGAPGLTKGASGLTGAAGARKLAQQRENLLRVWRSVPMSALPPDVPRGEAMEVLVMYALAQKRSQNDGNILLHRLAKKNNAAKLIEYADVMMDLKHKTHVHTKNRHGETPLHLASGAASARALLERGARLDARDSLGNTPIHQACLHQRLDVLEVMLEVMLDYGPDYSLLDSKNLQGYTALHLVVIHQPVSDPHRRALQLLIDSGVDLNVADDTGGRTALFHAVLHGDELAVRELVVSGSSVNLADFSETTPLQAAEDMLPADNNRICSILLERGGFKVPPADRVTQTGRGRGGGGGGSRRKAR